METADARDHLEYANRIIAQADRSLRPRGLLFILWGIVAASINLTWQYALAQPGPVHAAWFAPAAILWAIAVALTIRYSIQGRRCGGLNVIEQQFLRALWAAVICALCVDSFGWNVFPGWAMAGIWSIAYAIPLMFVGIQGHRFALAGGIVLLASIAVANFATGNIGFALAAGDLIGMTGLGIAFEVERSAARG